MTLITLDDFEHEHKLSPAEPFRGQGGVHVAGPGIPPGAAAIERSGSCPFLIHSEFEQFFHAGAAAFPLPPLAAAEFAPHPGVEFLEDDFYPAEAVVGRPTTQNGVEVFSDEAPKVAPRLCLQSWRTLSLSRATLCAAALSLGLRWLVML